MNTKELAEKLSRTQHLYQFRGYSSPTDCAQDQLRGKTYYVEPDTLRFHKGRVLAARPLHEGLFYWIFESCSLDYENTRRGFRAVLFDLFGNTVYRPSLDECRKSRSAAETDFQSWANTFDPIAHYRQNLTARADKMTATAQAFREIFETVEVE